MSEKCVLDEDNCLSLDSISRAFHCGVKEEHSWALIHQSMVSLKEDINEINENHSFVESTNLFIRSNGTIHPKSWHSSSSMTGFDSIRRVVSSIGTAVYKALDYGTSDDEEIVISSVLENVFDCMTQDITADEGIEDGTEDSIVILDELIYKCKARIIDNTDICEHYRNVCRALVAEAIDISTFLFQISIGTQELKRMNNRVDNEEVDCIQREVWIHIWMKVMQQLRNGVKLKTIDRNELINRQQREYELTPFEMLLDDINSKRYSLKKVISLPKEVEKDARTLILDFIRSRPPLKPATERQLNPLPAIKPSLHQKLMDGIKSSPNLKPSPRPFERKFDSFHMQRGIKRYSLQNQTINDCKTEESIGNVFQRFSFRNLSLRSGPINRNQTLQTVPESTTNTSDINSRKISFWDKFCKTFW